MRIAVGQLWQETNTLNPLPTTRSDFERFGVSRGAEMVQRMATTNELGGFIQSLHGWPERPEVVGLVRLPAWPGGLITAEAFEWLRGELIQSLSDALPLDGVLLALHGAMAAQRRPDVEGDVLHAVRQVVGRDIPLVATLDLHANITPAMVENVDALVIYHCAPHVDVYETGQRGAALLRRILVEGARPVTAFQKIPAVMPPENADTQAAAGMSADFKGQLQQWEMQREVLAAGLATVQPWMDVPQLGSAVVITTDDDSQFAGRLCSQLADDVWRRRREYMPELVSISDAVSRAHQLTDGLTVLSDGADATTSGAPGDSVWILKELLGYQWSRPALLTLVAPEIVQQADQLGAGTALRATLGGVRDDRFGTTVELEVEIENLFDARFTLTGHIGKNMPIDMGRSVVLRHEDIHIVVTSRSGPHFAPELFQAAGFDPFAAAVVVAKSPCGFRAVYDRRAAQMIGVKAPGCAPSDFWNYGFNNIPRPLWPWDEIDDWQSEPTIISAR